MPSQVRSNLRKRTVLVLNSNWVPINLISAQHALSILLSSPDAFSSHAGKPRGVCSPYPTLSAINVRAKAAWLNPHDLTVHTATSRWAVTPLSTDPTPAPPVPPPTIASTRAPPTARPSTSRRSCSTPAAESGPLEFPACASDTVFIASPTIRVRIPQAIVLAPALSSSKRVAPLRPSLFTRRTVLARDRYLCGYCGAPATTVDHVRPRPHGGESNFANCVASCRVCNTRKGNLSLKELGMRLRKGVQLRPPDPIVMQRELFARYQLHWAELLKAAGDVNEAGVDRKDVEDADA